MKICYRIKRAIDEAERADMFPREVEAHLSACDGCRSFAGERARLREMLGATTRVAAPVNFDAMLKAKLAARSTTERVSWLTPAAYMRFGAAAAVLLLAVFAAQYAGYFNDAPEGPFQSGLVAKEAEAPAIAPVANPEREEQASQDRTRAVAPARVTGGLQQVRYDARQGRATRGGGEIATARKATDYAGRDAAIVLVRGQNGERQVPIQTVSVGAQPLIYANAGRQMTIGSRASF